MAPNFYIDCPIEMNVLFGRLKDRTSTACLLHEIRAIAAFRSRGLCGDIMADRQFLVPLILNKISSVLAARWEALQDLDASLMLNARQGLPQSATACEMIWRTAWNDASTEGQIERRLATMQTARRALTSIETWFAPINTETANTAKGPTDYRAAASLVP